MGATKGHESYGAQADCASSFDFRNCLNLKERCIYAASPSATQHAGNVSKYLDVFALKRHKCRAPIAMSGLANKAPSDFRGDLLFLFGALIAEYRPLIKKSAMSPKKVVRRFRAKSVEIICFPMVAYGKNDGVVHSGVKQIATFA
jgi:hypothetical protein